MNVKPNPLFVAIAEALGYTVDTIRGFDDGVDQTRGTLITPEGNKIHVATGGYYHKDKVNFSMSFPEHVVDESGATRGTSQRSFDHKSEHFDGINVSAAKTPAQIAKDVQRRFLPTANALWSACNVWCEEQALYYSTKQVFKTEVDALMQPYGYGANNRRVLGVVEYIGKDYATIKLDSLKIEQVRKLAEFLKTI